MNASEHQPMVRLANVATLHPPVSGQPVKAGKIFVRRGEQADAEDRVWTIPAPGRTEVSGSHPSGRDGRRLTLMAAMTRLAKASARVGNFRSLVTANGPPWNFVLKTQLATGATTSQQFNRCSIRHASSATNEINLTANPMPVPGGRRS